MAEHTNSKSEDSSLHEHLLATKTTPQPKFTNNTTFSEVLMHDIMNFERHTLANLKKDVLIDLNLYIMNKHRNSPPVPTSNPVIDNLKSLEGNIQSLEKKISGRRKHSKESHHHRRDFIN